MSGLSITPNSSQLSQQQKRQARAILLAEAKRRKLPIPTTKNSYERYQSDPVSYAQDVLLQSWWAKQQEIAEALLHHKKVAIKASHSVGKSHVCAGLVNWYFDCFDPGLVLSTAPTRAQVEDILWKQVRAQRKDTAALQPRAPRMETSPLHFAAGYTARDSNAFQGRHEDRLLLIFDEADGIDGQFFDAAEGMTTGPNNRWLCIYNPTESSSRMKDEEDSGEWHVISISALEHPNIAAQLAGQPMPYPKAVSLEWVEDKVKKWCTRLDGSHKATDFQWPPESGEWFRPGPLFETRVLGRRSSLGIDTVWSDAAWEACLVPQEEPDAPVVIGCDVARFGDDDTTIYVARGNCVLHREAHNGWGTNETAGRLKQLCREFAQRSGQEAKKVEVRVDDDGVGGGVVDQRGEAGLRYDPSNYNFIPANGSASAMQSDEFPNRRSEVWFAGAQRAEEGRIDISRLPEEERRELKRQLQAPKYKLDGQGRRVVEPKAETKKRLKRSPDEADGFNLCIVPPKRRKSLVAY